MDKKIIFAFVAIFIIGVTLSFVFGGHSEAYENHEKYKYGFFPYYSTIDHKASEKDEEIAENFISVAKEAFTFCENTAIPDNFGELKYFVKNNYERGITRVEVELRLVTADFTFNKGYMWVEYDEYRYDSDNEVVSASGNILTYWKLKKTDGKWIVTDVKETP